MQAPNLSPRMRAAE